MEYVTLSNGVKMPMIGFGKSEIVNHYDPNFVKRLHGMKIHE